MLRRQQWPSVLILLSALAMVYVVGTTFFNIELERLVERTITPHIAGSRRISMMNRRIFNEGVQTFMQENHVRAIGYGCMGAILLLTISGLAFERSGLASLGSLGFVLSIYAYFVLHMSFLAGLGILTSLWQPFWGDQIKLGDIVYLPYMVLVYPFSLVGADLRWFAVNLFSNAGLLIFILGVLTWFVARVQNHGIADFWIYRYSRHPQYLGWILWSYGLMLRTSLRSDLVLQDSNPGASLPWVCSTLIILCVAYSEEIKMRREQSQGYVEYCRTTSFMLPLPGWAQALIEAPFKWITGKGLVEHGQDVVLIFFLYLVLTMLLSLPFLLFRWPPGGGWMEWPF